MENWFVQFRVLVIVFFIENVSLLEFNHVFCLYWRNVNCLTVRRIFRVWTQFFQLIRVHILNFKLVQHLPNSVGAPTISCNSENQRTNILRNLFVHNFLTYRLNMGKGVEYVEVLVRVPHVQEGCWGPLFEDVLPESGKEVYTPGNTAESAETKKPLVALVCDLFDIEESYFFFKAGV